VRTQTHAFSFGQVVQRCHRHGLTYPGQFGNGLCDLAVGCSDARRAQDYLVRFPETGRRLVLNPIRTTHWPNNICAQQKLYTNCQLIAKLRMTCRNHISGIPDYRFIAGQFVFTVRHGLPGCTKALHDGGVSQTRPTQTWCSVKRAVIVSLTAGAAIAVNMASPHQVMPIHFKLKSRP